jgi:DNA-binding transcriptional LysR family regulator
MELRHLRYFVTVAELLHFGRAAERLNIAQPPLSQQIKQLENELGVTLFVRANRTVRLTSAGTVFLREAQRILAHAGHAAEAARQADRGELGRLVVGFISSATYTVFTDILRGFHANFPGVEVILDESTTEQQLRALADGQIDLGFLRPPISDRSFASLTVVHEPIIAVVPDFHALARRGEIRLRELSGEAFISLPRRMIPGYFDQIVAACQQSGFTPRVSHEALQIQTIVNLVAAGMGVALVPASLRKAQRKGVRYLELTGSPLWADIEAVWRKDNASAPLRAFIDLISATTLAGAQRL